MPHSTLHDRLSQYASTAPLTEQEQDRVTFFAAVGHGISQWTTMETKIIHFGADLLDCNVEKAGVVFYSITNFYSWLNIIDELLRLDKRLSSVKREWNQVSTRLRKLNDIRVRLAHQTAYFTDLSFSDMCLRPVREDRRNKSQNSSILRVEEIVEFTIASMDMTQELTVLIDRLRKARMAL